MPSKEMNRGPGWTKGSKGKLVETGRWKARVKENWRETYLGTFNTREEAEMTEREFKNAAK